MVEVAHREDPNTEAIGVVAEWVWSDSGSTVSSGEKCTVQGVGGGGAGEQHTPAVFMSTNAARFMVHMEEPAYPRPVVAFQATSRDDWGEAAVEGVGAMEGGA